MDDLELRRVRPGDGERIRELNAAAMAETPEWVPEAPDEDLADVVGHYRERDGADFLVGVRDGRLVATGAYVPLEGWMAEQFDVEGSTAELTRMRVDPDRQGEGIGRRVYAALERRAASEGYERLVLNTGAENEVARRFYEGLGFVCVRVARVEWEDTELELALYERAIGE